MNQPQPKPINWYQTFVLCSWLLVMGATFGGSVGIGVWVYHYFAEGSCQK